MSIFSSKSLNLKRKVIKKPTKEAKATAYKPK
jgi:hypothetical protein